MSLAKLIKLRKFKAHQLEHAERQVYEHSLLVQQYREELAKLDAELLPQLRAAKEIHDRIVKPTQTIDVPAGHLGLEGGD